ncbi:hypothetical protein R1sor_014086 [Riccia sorocarpa]|uniref:C2H2-type domain-containing protein n=1 Tax=Riccia sorocarpa TaxID=122646 RepID=A0ABD3HBE3_9MARC
MYVCLIGECPRNARNAGKFEPHMLEHCFSGIDHVANERFLCTLKNRLGVRTPARLRRRSVAKPKDFVTLRRKLLARWSQTVSRKWQAFPAEAEKSALCRFGPEPKAPEHSLSTVLIDGLLLLDHRCDAGFWANKWNFELQECVLTACVKSTIAWLDDIVFDTDSEENIVLDSGDVFEDNVSHGQVTIPAPGDYIVSLSHDESSKQDNVNDLLPTPEKWIIPAVTSDDEAFQRRLSTIYVSEDGVASQP